MQTIKIKPKKGVLVRDPLTLKALSENGEEKPKNSYWLKRLKDGDVILTKTIKTKGAK